jgi:hypothetical protein
VARLFAAALDDDEQALRELLLLAFELETGTPTEVLEADRALRAIDGPRPDGSCPPNLENEGPTPGLVAYVDQLEARYRNEPIHAGQGTRPVARTRSQAADSA